MAGWADATQGQRIRAEKAKAFADNPQFAGPGSNDGDYAYPSRPVKINGPGTYFFDFGPLNDGDFVNFPPPASTVHPPGPAISLQFPADYPVEFAPSADQQPSVVTENGKRYLRLPLTLSHNARQCAPLVAWLS